MLKRGDIVRVAEGKPRPAVVIQSDWLVTPDRILLCPLTSQLIDAPIYRPTLVPDKGNGLLAPSQMMVDQIGAARRTRIDGIIGHLSFDDRERLSASLAIVLRIAG
ncbi:type II toxin-antitoxin system PemK/MazF family toxin [Sphingomonas rubra]|uniref:type II toxin-antitoxin system PemK/MazF family toxin n=1 Tax=Sphingomonas rubra TaxID=634430 RepID=UPI001FE18005|nr:type II toxin-antitoxin system PemK/MazF family toxin [Sphingomonas rubra]